MLMRSIERGISGVFGLIRSVIGMAQLIRRRRARGVLPRNVHSMVDARLARIASNLESLEGKIDALEHKIEVSASLEAHAAAPELSPDEREQLLMQAEWELNMKAPRRRRHAAPPSPAPPPLSAPASVMREEWTEAPPPKSAA